MAGSTETSARLRRERGSTELAEVSVERSVEPLAEVSVERSVEPLAEVASGLIQRLVSATQDKNEYRYDGAPER